MPDTYAVTPSAPLLQLHYGRSIQETFTAAWLSSRHDSTQHDDDNDDMWSMFDNSSYNRNDLDVSSAQAPPPADNINEDRTMPRSCNSFVSL